MDPELLSLLKFLAGVASVFVAAISYGIAYALVQWGRSQNSHRRAVYDAPPERDRPETPEDHEAVLKAILEAGQQHGDRIKEEWAEQKRADGWEEDEIEAFLSSRPLLELN